MRSSARAGGPATGWPRPTTSRPIACTSWCRGPRSPRWPKARSRETGCSRWAPSRRSRGTTSWSRRSRPLTDLRWTWSLVGASVDAEHATRLWAALWEAGLDDRVTLAGALTGSDLAAAYANADLLVLPSRHETYGIVASEALARGVPVLATDVGGVRESLGGRSGRRTWPARPCRRAGRDGCSAPRLAVERRAADAAAAPGRRTPLRPGGLGRRRRRRRGGAGPGGAAG